ncbi:glycosyl hydrolase family 39 [Rhodanobacter sp. 7MK24]|uniref:GH39 family glycosyl hydrolase n=1 Tax=Rhodanobacter sp. 7MK24 TaxID=2775922 RepID=UPI0017803C64|nr:glycosyl hydrolase family 39 [Rhodanobacter sp. 7MK24]MBD8881805.1 glycosyl hydrolase family 39 [Rhodanobacter sp. 7MK24]
MRNTKTMLRRTALGLLAVSLFAAGIAQAAAPAAGDDVRIVVDAKAQGTPFPHYWEQMFGSGRASLALRDAYRKDLTAVKQATDFGYVRFHGILDEDVGLFHLGRNGQPFYNAADKSAKDAQPVYNFSYVDQIYDGLLERGVRPFVELGFMPDEMSSDPKAIQDFWYRPNVAPPKDYALWDGMIRAFAQHLVARYGIDEVSRWYFEVWNEPNIGFWAGNPKMATYYTLYDHTARALKSVSPRLRVGGPATAQAAEVAGFLKHVHDANVPVDFVSTHVYGDDTADNVFHTSENIPRKDMVCRAVDKVHKEVLASPYPRLPFIMSEFNASYANLPNVTDSVYMGPWLANTIRACAGKVSAMSYWSFSDVFEEGGVVRTPFYGGFGLIAEDNIRKPSYNAFAMLHKLGDVQLQSSSDSALVTRRADGTLVLALWNYAPPVGDTADYTVGKPKGDTRHFEVDVSSLPATAAATVWRLDETHGNVIATFDRMGRPAFPSREQIRQLREAGQMAAPEQVALHGGKLAFDIPPQGLVVVEVH